MTWVVTPPANHTEADERVHAVAVFATRALDTLADAVMQLRSVAALAHDEEAALGLAHADAAIPFSVLADEVDELRTELFSIFAIHKAQLPRDVIDDLREGFRLANLSGPDHESKRKDITERVVGHPVDRLAELDPEEAKALRAELTNLEPKF